MRAQLARGINDDTYVDVDVEGDASVMIDTGGDDDDDDDDGDRPEPGDMEFSDDEEGSVEPVWDHVNEKDTRRLVGQEEEELQTEEGEHGAQDRSEGPWKSSLEMAAVPKPEKTILSQSWLLHPARLLQP